MKDERGLYYHPSMQDKAVRMYVREQKGEIQFRLFNPEAPEIWERHAWLPYDVIEQAAAMFKDQGNTDRNPLALYDRGIAQKLLQGDS